MSWRGTTRTRMPVGVCMVGTLLVLAGCTSDGGAAPAPTTAVEMTTTTAAPVGFSWESEADADAFVALPDTRIVNDGRAVAMIDGDSRRTLLRTPALEIGQAPDQSETIVGFDMGSGLSIIGWFQTSDGEPVVRFASSADNPVTLGAGTHPIASDDGAWVAWISPDGASVSLASAAGEVTEVVEPGGRVVDLVEADTHLGLLVASASGTDLILGSVDGGSWTQISQISVSSDAKLVARAGTGQFAVVSTNAAGASVTFWNEGGEREELLVIDHRLNSIDFSDDGTVAIAVTDEGASVWLTRTQSGILEDSPARSAQW